MFIEPKHLEIVKNILKKQIPNYEVWVFGSRAHGEHLKKFSDLDLAIIFKEKIPSHVISFLQEEFTESYLPFKVDLVDFESVNDEFKSIIKEKHEVIQPAKN